MGRITLAGQLVPLALVLSAAIGCAESSSSGQHVRVVHDEQASPPIGGIPPDKQAEIQLLLQQRDPSTLRCYQEVLNEKHDRAFKGTVMVVLTLEPAGKASDVKIIGGTLNNKEVSDCLVEKLKDFDYPQIPAQGSMQYVYKFEPAY